MQWFNSPANWQENAGVLLVTSAPKSDFWRKTHYNFVRDNGNFYYETVRGDFEVSVKITGEYRDLYDQAGLMLRLDAENWIKTGIEFFDGQQHASAVVTRDFSDWSVTRLSPRPISLWLRATRKAEAVNIFFSTDGQNYQLLRSAYLAPSAELQVGPMCASPEGQGFTAQFEHFIITPLTEGDPS